MFRRDDQAFMQDAIREGHKALASRDVPIGAIIVHRGVVVARAHNQVELLKDPTAHAEMIAITQAAHALQNERLVDGVLYTTVEPCVMCAGAMVLARLSRVVFGAADPKAGACGSVLNVLGSRQLNHRVAVTRGVLGEACGAVVHAFFRELRSRRRARPPASDRLDGRG